MKDFDVSLFFDCKDNFHSELWPEGVPVWYALQHLKVYLKTTCLGSIEVDIPTGVYLENSEEISIGKGTVIEPGSFIRGPCIIGKNCSIQHGAYIRGDVLVGDEAVVGHDTEVKHSIMFPKAKAAHFAYVGDSILGRDVNLGAGVKCANFRLDEKAVKVVSDGSYHETGLQKMGAIIGDRVQIGCNSVLNPGAVIGPDSILSPLLNFSGTIPAFSIARPKGVTRRASSRRKVHESSL